MELFGDRTGKKKPDGMADGRHDAVRLVGAACALPLPVV
jgi:hypothetical protein